MLIGVSLLVTKLVHNYLQNCKQIKKAITYSSWEEIVAVVPSWLHLNLTYYFGIYL